MKHKTLLINAVIFMMVVNLICFLTLPDRKTVKPVPQPVKPSPIAPESVKPRPPVPKVIEPTWSPYPAIRNINDASLGTVLLDIESHMPAGHIYKDNDKVTWAHETSHGLASNIRQKFGGGGKINGFYCLQDRAVVIQEPPTTIRAAASVVPRSLRGGVFQLYMVTQAASWNNEPLYVCDEWMGYSNGSAAGIDLAQKNLWKGYWRTTFEAKEDTRGQEVVWGGQPYFGHRRAETILYMLEFNVYTIAMASTIPQGYDHTQLKAFMMWNIERAMGLYKESKNHPDFTDTAHDQYLETLRTSGDAAMLRTFAQGYFGADWCKATLGF